MFVLHNALIVPEYMFQMNYKNRAFQYGDGFFETMIFTGEKVRFFDDHYHRIEKAVKAFSLEYPSKFSKENLLANIKTLIEKNAILGEARIKVMIYRSEGGLYEPIDDVFEILVTASERSIPNTTAKRKVDFFDDYPLHYTPSSEFKTMSSIPYVFAGNFAKKHGLDDVILINTKGAIAECLYTNIYWIKNDILYTPSTKTGCISGIMRKQIFASATACSIQINEGEYQKEDLLSADFVFNSNVTGFYPILNIEGEAFKSDHPIFETIREDIFANS